MSIALKPHAEEPVLVGRHVEEYARSRFRVGRCGGGSTSSTLSA